MPGEPWNKGGGEWQRLCVRILKAKFPDGAFVDVPDRVGGDGGIEGFTRDGTAYQCYASEELLNLEELTVRQKRKITEDTAKLKNNATLLSKLFGATVIRKWVLLVPCWEDKSLLVHANKKAAEVASSKLPFVDPSFQIAICTLEDYEEQTTLLGLRRPLTLEIDPGDLPPTAVEEWIKNSGNALVDNLDRKCRAIHADPANAARAREVFIKQMLKGQNTLERLRSRNPDFYEEASRLKRRLEEFLESESMIEDTQPPEKLRATLNEFQEELKKTLVGLDTTTVKHISFEAIVDWLTRCPLDFPSRKGA